MNNTQNLDQDYLVTSFQLRHRSAEMHASGLLGSANPGHIEPSDQLLKRLTMVIKARAAHIKFHLDQLYDNYRCCYFSLSH